MEIYLTLSGFIFACLVALLYEYKIRLLKKQRNNVHFYVAKDMNSILWLYLDKPIRKSYSFFSSDRGKILVSSYEFSKYGLNIHDFDYLKWEDEPVEVFLNLEN